MNGVEIGLHHTVIKILWMQDGAKPTAHIMLMVIVNLLKMTEAE